MNLPFQQTNDQVLSLLQSRWKSILDPIIASPLSNPSILTGVALAIGDNVINHRLGQKLVGWIVVGNNAASVIFDKQASNQTPNVTLVLNSSAKCLVNLLVF